jgi:hypothetical protein
MSAKVASGVGAPRLERIGAVFDDLLGSGVAGGWEGSGEWRRGNAAVGWIVQKSWFGN